MTSRPLFQYIEATELDSTNEEARRLLQAEALNRLTIIRADSQTAGRGTQGRSWISPPGAGLYFSLVHPFFALTDVQPNAVPLTPIFTLAVGVACAETIEELSGLRIHLKPINDLYVHNRKLGGILVESLMSSNQCKALITGIGINIFRHADLYTGCEQEGRGNQPTSLQDCIPEQLFNQWHGDAIKKELCHTIAENVHRLYLALIAGEESLILERYEHFKQPDDKAFSFY
jgi:BirA family biotin operon repressor/biotin-[acetyl-CoA-carboxylase] ligase